MELLTAGWNRSGGWSTPLPDWDGPGTLVLVFGSSGLLDDDTPLQAVATAFPGSAVIGCSTSGEILDTGVYDDSLTVAVARFRHTALAVESEPVNRSESVDAGRAIGKRLAGRGNDLGDLAAVFVLGDGMEVNGGKLGQGLSEGTGGTAVITGGLAGDGSRFERTWVLVDGRAQTAHVTAVGLYGKDLEVGHAFEGGWTILGPERTITRSEGNVLLELDGQPALELYKTYLGDRVSGLPATALLFPLAIKTGNEGDRELVRTVLGVDESRQSMTFAGDVPQGSTARLMRGTTEGLVDAAQVAATKARIPGDETSLAIAVSCVGRRLYLGQRVEDELEAVTSGLGPNCGLVGFYSYGELSPVSAGSCDLHNQTMTITVFGERAA
jgi:hypothetical protein